MKASFQILLPLSMLLFISCAAPFRITLHDNRYKSEQPTITITPIYTNSANINMLMHYMPMMYGMKFDETYMKYEERYIYTDQESKKYRNMFILVVTTRY